MLYPKQYSVAVTVVKGLVAAFGTGGLAILAAWLIDAVQTGDFTMSPEQSAAFAAMCGAAFVALKNFLKVKLGWNWIPVLAVAALIGAQGCASMTPALAGKTKVQTEFSDVLTAEGGQDTHYNQTISAPAGVEVKDLSSMGYDWSPDGGGNISISQNRGANTTAQSDALVQVNAAQMQLIGQMMEQIVALAGIAAPLVGGKIAADADLGQAREANKALVRGQLIELLRDPEVLRALRGARPPRKPEPTPEPTPADDVLGVAPLEAQP